MAGMAAVVGIALTGPAMNAAGAAEEPEQGKAMVLHVAPDGDDANPGTREEPLGPLRDARDAVRQRIAEGLDRDVRVVLHEGRYRLTEPLNLGPKDSGTAEHSITWTAAERGDALITGGRRITGSHVADVSGNGVMIGEDRSRRVQGEPWWRSAPDQAADGNTVTDNVIERCGRRFFGAVGVWVGLTRGTRVAHNAIRELPYTGVSLGWMWNPTPTPSRDNVVEYNHIHDVMQTLSDGGGIYTLGRQPGGRLRGNHIHGVPLNAGRAESNGMFLDQGTTELTIEQNVIHDVERSPLRFHQAKENLVRNNVLVLAEDVPVVRYNATDSELITLESNRIVSESNWDPASAQDWIDRAGPRREASRRSFPRSGGPPRFHANAPCGFPRCGVLPAAARRLACGKRGVCDGQPERLIPRRRPAPDRHPRRRLRRGVLRPEAGAVAR